MSHPAMLVFLATDFGWDLPGAKSPTEAWGRGFHHHETWNPSRACSGLSPHLTLQALAARKVWGHGTHPVPTKSCHCCWGGGGCRAAGSAAVKPRRSSRQGRRPMTPIPPGSNSTSALTAMSCTPARTPCCPRSSGIWPRKGSSAWVPPPCPHPCPYPCPAACCLPLSSPCTSFQSRSPAGPSSSSS